MLNTLTLFQNDGHHEINSIIFLACFVLVSILFKFRVFQAFFSILSTLGLVILLGLLLGVVRVSGVGDRLGLARLCWGFV